MKIYTRLMAAAALLIVTAGAYAVPIEATYSVDANNGDGLAIQTSDASSNPFIYNLMMGQSQTFALFNIYTNEGSVNSDDEIARDIFVDFAFLQPGTGTTTVSGQTEGRFGGLFTLFAQEGRVRWDGPEIFTYGMNGDGQIQVALEDAIFNRGSLFGLDEGENNGAEIFATITLLQQATISDVPEPHVLAMFGLMLVGGGFAARRRKVMPRI